MTGRPIGLVLYHGPSRLDGAPIVVIATGLARASTNPKTGPMIQIWILTADVAPYLAARTGLDTSTCGDCPLRPFLAEPGAVACYVRVGDAPTSVWRAWRGGAYVDATAWTVRDLAAVLEPWPDRGLRFGAYGEPAAVPPRVLRRLLQVAPRWTSYTHQWRRFPSLRAWSMASVDSVDEAHEAQARGWRTFRHSETGAPLAELNEIGCPAAPENGSRTTCARCRLCDGRASTSTRSIVIQAHGNRPGATS